jgi:UDP-2,4-diacetamido-2,4,6-trideoxy-beta-L-altropyranose hydrolase
VSAKKIIFRADGNSTVGLGHIYREIALLGVIKEHFDCLLLSHIDDSNSWLFETVPHQEIPDAIKLDTEPDWLVARFDPESTMVILDGYNFSASYQSQLKENGFKVAYIDDLAKERVVADIIFNHALDIEKEEYESEPYTKFALGPKYALLRNEFLIEAQTPRTDFGSSTVFVCFGGADPFQLSLKTVSALMHVDQAKEINVVVSNKAIKKQLEEQADQFTKPVHIHHNIDANAMIKIMKSSDYAIVPSSTICYELFTVNIPILAGYFIDNQINLYYSFVMNKLVARAGDLKEDDETTLIEKIQTFMARTDLADMIQQQQKVIDDQVANRFVKLIDSLFKTNMELKKVTLNDWETLFKWRNDTVTRENSHNSEPVSKEQHLSWLENSLQNENRILLMAYHNEVPAGTVRADIKEGVANLSWTISPDERGKGFGKLMVKKFVNQLAQPVHAEVKSGNVASIKIAEYAGLNKDYESEGIIHFKG